MRRERRTPEGGRARHARASLHAAARAWGRAFSVEDLAGRWSMPAEAVRRIPRDALPYLVVAGASAPDARRFLREHVEAYERRGAVGDASPDRALTTRLTPAPVRRRATRPRPRAESGDPDEWRRARSAVTMRNAAGRCVVLMLLVLVAGCLLQTILRWPFQD